MAKIDITKIEGYADMSVEDKLKSLEAFEYEDNVSELERLKNANSKANSEAAEWKRKHNALLDEDEKKKQADSEAIEQMKQELDELRKEKKVSDYKSKYLAQGYDEKLAAETAAALADGNMDKVFANGEKFKAEMEKKIKAEILKGTPKPDVNNGGGKAVTKEQFDAMGYTERVNLKSENPELYKELMNGGNE